MARLYTRREARNRKMTFKIFAGMFDFIGTVASAVIIILCVVLLVQLVKWIAGDFDSSFGAMVRMLQEAVDALTNYAKTDGAGRGRKDSCALLLGTMSERKKRHAGILAEPDGRNSKLRKVRSLPGTHPARARGGKSQGGIDVHRRRAGI